MKIILRNTYHIEHIALKNQNQLTLNNTNKKKPDIVVKIMK